MVACGPVGERAAFFDVDGTLVRGHLMAPWTRVFVRWGVVRKRAIAKAAWRQALWRAGWFDERRLDRMWAETLAWLRGRERDVFAAQIRRAYRETGGAARVSPGARARIEEHRRAGHRLVIASSGIEESIAPLAEDLGFEAVICTRLETADGRFTGRMVGPPCYGAAKEEAARAWAEGQGVDLSASWFYSDTISDLPLLEAVGHPVAVNPDRELSAVARARRWPAVRG